MSEPRLALWKSRFTRLWLAAGAPVLGALGSVARNKWLALHLDPAGLGTIGQVVAGQTWLGTFTGLGLSVPVARAIGAALGRGDAPGVRRTLSTALAMVSVTTTLAALLGLAAAPWVSALLFGTPEHAALVRISMVAVVGLGFQTVVAGMFAGHSDVRAPFTYALAGNLVMVATVVLTVPRFGLAGAVWGISAFWPAALAAALFAHRRAYAGALAAPAGARFDRGEGVALLRVALAALLMGLADLGVMLALRSHVVRAAGLAANGLLQASIGLSQQLGSLVYAYLAAYAFGRISGLPDAAAMRDYTRRQWAPLMGLALLGCVAAALLATPLLHLLYSDRFDAARPMLAWMLVGEFAKVGLQVWALGALPLGGVRLWVPLGLAGGLGMAVAYPLAIAAGAGAMALPYAYAAGGVFALLVGGTLMSRRGVTLRARDLALAVAGLALLATIARAVSR